MKVGLLHLTGKLAGIMEIRKDFESAATYLYRLFGISDAFRRFATEDWSHMKNQEDFEKVYRMDNPLRNTFESLYGDGRDMAHYMADHLRMFNSMEDFPSMTSYVESFERTWCANLDDHTRRYVDLQQHVDKPGTPWAVRQMIGLWEKQIKLLREVNSMVNLLKQTDIYRVEKGEIKVTDLNKQNVNVGVIGNVHGSKINVGSTDNSTTINISTHQVFTNIKDALSKSETPATEKQALIKSVDAMESEVGNPTFLQRYQDFIAAGANHMTILAPFIPALTSLLRIPGG
jgi:hypothetical protein